MLHKAEISAEFKLTDEVSVCVFIELDTDTLTDEETDALVDAKLAEAGLSRALLQEVTRD